MHDLAELYLALCEGIDTPRSLGCWLRFKAGEWDEIAMNRISPTWYNSADSYKNDAIAVDFLRKCKDLPCTFDREEAAVKSFIDAEKRCANTNARLTPFLLNGPLEDHEVRLLSVIDRVKEKVKQLLGRAPGFIEGTFGPGATLSDTGGACSVPHKCCSHPTITRDALHVLPMWARTAWARGLGPDRVVDIVEEGRFASADKDAKTDRGIIIGQSVNVFYQLGLGRIIRKRLKQNAGLDLRTLQATHRQVACVASKDNMKCTIDLKSASDTIAKVLVKLLFPVDWYDLLASLRTKSVVLPDGRTFYLEMFSSMGNGYTFELETLLFFAVCHTVASHKEDISVYGDDIICHRDDASNVLAALKFFGFVPSVDKTFVDGPFRESCGGDFYDGTDVRPYYLKELPREPQDWIGVANGIRRFSVCDGFIDPRHLRAWFTAVDALPAAIRRCRGPEELGDLLIHDSQDRWSSRVRSSIRYIRAYLPAEWRIVEWRRFPASAVLAAALYGVRNAPIKELRNPGLIPRDGVTGYALGWVPFS